MAVAFVVAGTACLPLGGCRLCYANGGTAYMLFSLCHYIGPARLYARRAAAPPMAPSKATARDMAAALELIDKATSALDQAKAANKISMEEHWVQVLSQYFGLNRPARVAQAAAA